MRIKMYGSVLHGGLWFYAGQEYNVADATGSHFEDIGAAAILEQKMIDPVIEKKIVEPKVEIKESKKSSASSRQGRASKSKTA